MNQCSSLSSPATGYRFGFESSVNMDPDRRGIRLLWFPELLTCLLKIGSNGVQTPGAWLFPSRPMSGNPKAPGEGGLGISALTAIYLFCFRLRHKQRGRGSGRD